MHFSRLSAYSILLFAFLVLAALPPLVQAQLDCTDFLTFSYPGYTKLPQDAFDYDTSVRVLRVASGRLDSFAFPDAEKGYFFVPLTTYVKANASSRGFERVAQGTVLYQYTKGNSEFYYRVLNGTTIPWFCNLEKMAELTVAVQNLSGTFYASGGQKLNLSRVGVVAFDAGTDNGFLVAGFGTARRFYVGTEDNAASFPIGYVIYDAGNSTYFATEYKQARFHVPANTTAFCNNYASLCLDASGPHASACKGAGVQTFSCSSNQCVGTLTACKYGCDQAACLDATPTQDATVAVTAEPTATVVAPSATATPTPVAAPSAAPKSNGGVSTALGVIVLLALVAGAYLLFFQKRRPKGL